jgi:hypothetical protein
LASASDINPGAAAVLAEIVSAKSTAASLDDFDRAKILKVAETKLRELSDCVLRLESQKKICAASDDFDRASALKIELVGANKSLQDCLAHTRGLLLESSSAHPATLGGAAASGDVGFSVPLAVLDGRSALARDPSFSVGVAASDSVSKSKKISQRSLKISVLKGLITRNGGSYVDIDSTQSKRAVKAALTQRLREILDSSSPGCHFADVDVDKLVNDEVEVEVRVISTLNHYILEGVAAVGPATPDEAAVSSDSDDDSDSSGDELDGSVDLNNAD